MAGGGFGIPILSGILGGAGGFMQNAAAAAEKQQALERQDAQAREQARHNLAVEALTQASTQTPQGQLFSMLGIPLPAGADPNASVNPTFAVEAAKIAEARRLAAVEQSKLGELSSAVQDVGARSDTSSRFGQGDIQGPPSPLRDPRMVALSQLVPALTLAEASKLVTGQLAPQQPHFAPAGSPGYATAGGGFTATPQPEGGLPEGEVVDLAKGTKRITMADSRGLVRTREVPLSTSDKMGLHTDRLVNLTRKAAREGLTPEEQQQYRDSWITVNTLGPYQNVPGAYNVPRGPLGAEPLTFGSTPPAPGAPMPTAGTIAPGGAYRGAPPVMSQSEAEKVGMRNYIVSALDAVAAQAATMPQLNSAGERGSFAVRGFLAGKTPFATLSAAEQNWVTTHENLRTQLIGLQTGLGSFRSPELQDLYKQIIGKYWSPETMARLQTLANMVRAQAESINRAQVQGGLRDVPPLARTTPPVPGVDIPEATDRVPVIAPDGTPGSLPAGAAIPPGYRRR